MLAGADGPCQKPFHFHWCLSSSQAIVGFRFSGNEVSLHHVYRQTSSPSLRCGWSSTILSTHGYWGWALSTFITPSPTSTLSNSFPTNLHMCVYACTFEQAARVWVYEYMSIFLTSKEKSRCHDGEMNVQVCVCTQRTWCYTAISCGLTSIYIHAHTHTCIYKHITHLAMLTRRGDWWARIRAPAREKYCGGGGLSSIIS